MENPPEGAAIDYYLPAAASGGVTLEILQPDGRLVRRYTSADTLAQPPDPSRAQVPLYWYRPPRGLSAAAGLHRFFWDVHYQRVPAIPGAPAGRGSGLSFGAIPRNTPPPPATPWAGAGTYTARLTVDGRSYTQPITVKLDPRVRTPATTMQEIYSLSASLYYDAAEAQAAVAGLVRLREQVRSLAARASGDAARALAAFAQRADSLRGLDSTRVAGAGGGLGAGPEEGGGAAAFAPGGLSAVALALARAMNLLQAADVAPTAAQRATIAEAQRNAAAAMARWKVLRTTELANLNTRLGRAGMAQVGVRPPSP
jgi:hypothetical protein